MKIIKYLFIFAVCYLLLQRPFVTVVYQVEDDRQLPVHTKQVLGTQIPRKGADISYYQGQVNFVELAQHIDFVYIKATQGETYEDPAYQQNAVAVSETKLLHGAYHFFEPDMDPEAQARHFVHIVKGNGHSLPPMLDVEVSNNESVDSFKQAVSQWLKYVEQALGCTPIIYSYADFWSQYLGPEFNRYPFWLADYSEKPSPPAGVKNWRLWQYSSKGRLPGIEYGVDLDLLIDQELKCHV